MYYNIAHGVVGQAHLVDHGILDAGEHGAPGGAGNGGRNAWGESFPQRNGWGKSWENGKMVGLSLGKWEIMEKWLVYQWEFQDPKMEIR